MSTTTLNEAIRSEEPQPEKSYPVRDKTRRSHMALAIVSAVILAGSIALDLRVPAAGTMFGVGALLWLWSARALPVRLQQQHLELKLAPLAGLRRVRYDEVRRLVELRKDRLRLELDGGKQLTIPLRMLSTEHGVELKAELSRRTGL